MTTDADARLRRMFFLRGRQRQVQQRIALYDQQLTPIEIEFRQVEHFNRVWRYCLDRVPFYQRWARAHGLPDRIADPADLGGFPVLQKRDIVDHADEIFQNGRITDAYSTGGTTGTPTRYPRGPGETEPNYANTYAGRRWWGLEPFDGYVHLWGHSHLFGAGGRGSVARVKRQALDRLVNAVRLNAYDMTEQALREHYEALRKKNPVYLVGYTSTVVKLAHYLEHNGLNPEPAGRLKAVIVTAETVTAPDVALIARVFRTPVITEYGSAETGTIAVSRGDTWPLQVFWNSFVVMVADDGALSVTTLEDRLFPLINYGIGDTGAAVSQSAGSALQLAAVHGRTQDVVRVGTTDGSVLELSAILPVHILKCDPRIVAVQFRQEEAGRLRIFLYANCELPLDDVGAFFVQQMRNDHPAFDPSAVTLEQIAEPILTKAGKHALFVS